MGKTKDLSTANRRDVRPTLKTVADACGLAVTTVSRALNDGEDIALRTRTRVKRVAADLGYVPNRAGQGLRTGRTNVLHLLLAPHAEITSYTASIIEGFSRICRSNGYELSISPDTRDEDELTAVKSIVENRRADGIVLSRTMPNDLRVRYLLEHEFPFVTHGLTELATPHASVDYDNQAFAELAVNRLIKKGRKRLMLIGAAPGLTYQTHLETGFVRGLARNGLKELEPPGQYHLETPLPAIRRDLCARFQQANAPEGIVCAGELAALAASAGIRDAGGVPGVDVDIVSKQTSSVLDYVDPPMDSCFEDIVITGELLGNTLLQVLRNTESKESLCHVIAPQERFRT
ncbi:MAG: LacI family transcriptional regulator [Granulosicoccus sp.]